MTEQGLGGLKTPHLQDEALSWLSRFERGGRMVTRQTTRRPPADTLFTAIFQTQRFGLRQCHATFINSGNPPRFIDKPQVKTCNFILWLIEYYKKILREFQNFYFIFVFQWQPEDRRSSAGNRCVPDRPHWVRSNAHPTGRIHCSTNA